MTRARLRAAGLAPQGRHGPHAFRHARAVSLLRSGVPLKIIGEVNWGIALAQATAEYRELATDDLRAIGLQLPSGVCDEPYTASVTRTSSAGSCGRSTFGI